MPYRFAIAVIALLLVANSTLADIPGPGRRTRPPGPPRPVPQEAAAPAKATVAVKIQQADLAKEGKDVRAKIAIPRKVLAKIAPPMAAIGAAGEEQHASLPWWSTVIAGIALSAGAVGVIVIARGNKAARVVGTVGLVVAALAGGFAMADLRIPDEDRRPAGDGSVILEIVEEGDVVVLTLPPA